MNIKLQKISCDDNLCEQIISQINNDLDDNIGSNTYLLDTNKDNFNIIEKFVYDFTIKELDNIGKKLDDDIFVEFWYKNKFGSHVLHVDCDEFEKANHLNYLYPLFSCISYFNNSEIPTLITNIDMERYKYKDYENDISLFLSFPEKNKQLIFEPKYFHGSVILDDVLSNINDNNEDSRFIVLINIWDRKPTNVSHYPSLNNNTTNNNSTNNNTTNNNSINLNHNKEIPLFHYENLSDFLVDIPFSSDKINSEFMEKLLYEKDKNVFFDLKETIYNCKNNDNHNDYNKENNENKFTLYKLFLDKTQIIYITHKCLYQ
jgi:hypothetical protein